MPSGSDLVKAAVLVGWLGVQAALILTAGARPEHAFGFRMFAEASTVQYSLSRGIRAGNGVRELPCPAGRYTTRAGRSYDWHTWVRQAELGAFDREIVASYGAEAQRSRLEAALRWYAGNVEHDAESEYFVVSGFTTRNGGERVPFRFQSAPVGR